MAKVINLTEYKNTIEERVIDDSISVGHNMLWELLDYEPNGTDNTGIIFSIWTGLMIQLYLRGWTKENLIEELERCQQIAKEIEETS